VGLRGHDFHHLFTQTRHPPEFKRIMCLKLLAAF